MSKQAEMRLRGSLTEPLFPFKFRDEDRKAISSHLSNADRKRLARLTDVLNDWANHDLQKAFLIYPDATAARERLNVCRLVAKHAEGLRLALEHFERFDGSTWLVRKLIDENF